MYSVLYSIRVDNINIVSFVIIQLFNYAIAYKNDNV